MRETSVLFVVLAEHDFTDADDFFARLRVDIHETHALRGTAGNANIFDGNANRLSGFGEQHRLIGIRDGNRSRDAELVFNCDDAAPAAVLNAEDGTFVVVERRAFADPVASGDKEHARGIDDFHRDDGIVGFETHSDDARRRASEIARVRFVETNGHAFFGNHDDFVVPGRKFDGDELVALFQIDGDDSVFAAVFIFGERGFLDGAVFRAEKHVLRFGKFLDAEHCGEFFAFLHGNDV